MDPSDRFTQKDRGTSGSGVIHRPWQSTGLLLVSFAVAVLIEESMGLMIERGVNELNLPAALGGGLVAMLILMPKVLNAIRATRQGSCNELSTRCSDPSWPPSA